jgi:hypothetical protein
LVHLVLELKGSLVDEDACAEVFLGGGLVFAGDLLEDLFYLAEVVVAGVLVAVDFVLELRLGGGCGDASQEEEEVGGDSHGGVGEVKVADEVGTLLLNLSSSVAVGVGLVGKSLPVEAASILLNMVELVILKIERAVASSVLIPGDLRLCLSIHVDPDKTLVINVNMKREKTVLGSIKARKILVQRSLGKLSVHTVGPAVVLARQDVVLTIVLDNDRKGSVTADVVETADSTLSVADEEEIKTSFSVADPRASLLKSHLVSKENPFLGEDGSSFKFIDVVRLVPC